MKIKLEELTDQVVVKFDQWQPELTLLQASNTIQIEQRLLSLVPGLIWALPRPSVLPILELLLVILPEVIDINPNLQAALLLENWIYSHRSNLVTLILVTFFRKNRNGQM